ncbi:MAG: hypothetical protein AAFV53_28665 [Myxococcota bacterium]
MLFTNQSFWLLSFFFAHRWDDADDLRETLEVVQQRTAPMKILTLIREHHERGSRNLFDYHLFAQPPTAAGAPYVLAFADAVLDGDHDDRFRPEEIAASVLTLLATPEALKRIRRFYLLDPNNVSRDLMILLILHGMEDDPLMEACRTEVESFEAHLRSRPNQRFQILRLREEAEQKKTRKTGKGRRRKRRKS